MIAFLKANSRILLELLGLCIVAYMILAPRYASKITISSHKIVTGNSTTNWHTKTKIQIHKNKDGTETITETKDTDGTKQAEKQVSESKEVTKTKDLSRYSLEIDQRFPKWNFNTSYDPYNSDVVLGLRIFSLPFFGTIGIDGEGDPSLGVRAEW